jgi:hypothetical protein
MNWWESANGDSLVNYKGHNRNYGFNTSLNPRERLGLEFAYNYNDYQQNAFICFNDSDKSLPVVANAGSCLANGYDDMGNNTSLTYGTYLSHTHFGQASVRFKPIPRVTVLVGYSITSVSGDTPQFNALQPLGSLDYQYQQPLGNIAVDLGHHLAAIGGWNYYQYGEGSFIGPTSARNFHANNVTGSLRWAF